jgi:hypothetical protein
VYENSGNTNRLMPETDLLTSAAATSTTHAHTHACTHTQNQDGGLLRALRYQLTGTQLVDPTLVFTVHKPSTKGTASRGADSESRQNLRNDFRRDLPESGNFEITLIIKFYFINWQLIVLWCLWICYTYLTMYT